MNVLVKLIAVMAVAQRVAAQPYDGKKDMDGKGKKDSGSQWGSTKWGSQWSGKGGGKKGGGKKGGANRGPGMSGGDEVAEAPDGTLVDIVVATPELSTLLTAVLAAELEGALAEPGPFTVLAPDNDAFAQIPAADLAALLEDKEALTAILTYHVIPDEYLASDIPYGDRVGIPTLNGATVWVSKKKCYGKDYIYFYNGDKGESTIKARVLAADILATNGVAHIIDEVLIPL